MKRLYAQIVLALLAALIPIIGSLYAGATFLYDAVRADHELRVRQRIAPLVEKHMQIEDALRTAVSKQHGRDYDARSRERRRFEDMLLTANGIGAKPVTYRDHEISVAMSMPVVPKRERQRQAVVISTAILGVVLLALDNLTP